MLHTNNITEELGNVSKAYEVIAISRNTLLIYFVAILTYPAI